MHRPPISDIELKERYQNVAESKENISFSYKILHS